MIEATRGRLCAARIVATVAGLLAASVCANSVAVEVPKGWKTECVGRYQISVPGDVESALVDIRALLEPKPIDPFRFSDGGKAPYSTLIYQGEIFVSGDVKESDVVKLRKDVGSRISSLKKELREEGDTAAANQTVWVPLNTPNAFAWRVEAAVHLFLARGGRLFNLKLSGYPEETKNNLQRMQSVLHSLRPRPVYDLPTQQGVCIPYGFIADDGTPGRRIGVTMRLKDHPDVEIFFQDETASKPQENRANRNAEEEIKFFLMYRYRDFAKLVELDFPGFRSIELAGQEGKAAVADITRHDGSKDYGYMAYVKGNADAKTEAPNLMLYVIRTAARAKGEPISKSELKDMAHKIAASIKRRE
jgi:hypothetical protein